MSVRNSLHTLGILCYIGLIVASVAGGLAWMGGYWDEDSKTTYAELTRAAYTLEEELITTSYVLPALSKPVIIRVLIETPDGQERDSMAYTVSDDARYTIVVYYNNEITFQSAVNSLIHEYAHAMVWDSKEAHAQDHGHYWGLAYAWCYRILIEEPLENELVPITPFEWYLDR